MTALRERVSERAGDRCEYCGLPAWTQAAQFHIDHIVPSSQGGGNEDDNRAYTCPHCNLHKAAVTHAPDPQTNLVVALFNPRLDNWPDHFCRSTEDDWVIVGTTPTGRATVEQLQLNHPRLVTVRELLAKTAMRPLPG